MRALLEFKSTKIEIFRKELSVKKNREQVNAA